MPTAIIEARGPDAERYLNGQVTHDVRQASAEPLPICVTDAKGRLQAIGYVTRTGDDVFRLELQCTDAQEIFDRLDRYLIADECELNLIAQSEIPSLSPEENDARILAKQPIWDHEITPGLHLAEVGLDRIHVSFAKGCYIGQEVISRVKAAGKVNRTLQLFSVRDLPGDAALPLKLAHGGKSAGEITSLTSDRNLALGFLHRRAEGAASLDIAGGGQVDLDTDIT